MKLTMGSMDQPPRSTDNFQDVKTRIDGAFLHLKKEMQEIQKQDIFLLKQLMYIRHTILLLSRFGDRRCYSISALDVPSTEVVLRSDLTPSIRRSPLTRVQSAPLETHLSEEIIPEEEEDFEDELAQSFNSSVSEPYASNQMSVVRRAGCPAPETDFIYALGPLPPVFQRLLASSTQQNDNENSDTTERLSNLMASYKPVPVATQVERSEQLIKLVAKRKMLQKQKAVDDCEGLGNNVIDNLQRLQLCTHDLGVQV